MQRTAKALILVLLLAALPLRGYAGVLAALCEARHSGASAMHAHDHAHTHGSGESREHSDHDHDPADNGDGTSRLDLVCSLLTSSLVNVTFAPDTGSPMVNGAPGSDQIPFLARRASRFVPEHLDRPPLSR